MGRIRISLFLIAAAATLTGCALSGGYYHPSYPDRPDYVYLYPDGCWADDLWYSPCPWVPGPYWGYYRHHGGYFYWQQHHYWQYRPGYPPPGHWRHRGWHRHPQVPRYPAHPPRHRPPHHRR